MLSKLKTYLNMCIHPRLKYMPISLKLAFIYSIMLCLILIVTLSSTLIGIHYVLFHEAEVSINLSANYVEKKANNETVPELLQDVKSSALIPGVVMRVTDSNNNIVYDSLPMYISINHVQDSLARQEENLSILNIFGFSIRKELLSKTMKRIHFISCERLQQKKYF